MNLYNLFQTKADDQIDEAYHRPFRGVGGRREREDDERHDLDPTDWYFVKDGKMFAVSVYPNQVQQAIALGYSRTREEARAKASQSGLAEAPASAAVRLGRAVQRVQGRTAASQARAVIPSSLPKPDTKPPAPVKENAQELQIGDPVIVTGPVEFEGSTGEIADFGSGKRFVVVDLYNHGKHSFHSSDISYNDYADSDEEEARMYDTDPNARAHGVTEAGGNYDDNRTGFGRGHDHRGLEQELAHETNNIAIAINGRVWKVVAGRGYADSREERSYLNNMKKWAERKSASSGKKWTVYLTGANVSESHSVAEVKQRLDPKCWKGYKKQGTKMKGDTRVNNCVPNTTEAANPAQQAAIAIAKKKQQGVAEVSSNTLKRYKKAAQIDIDTTDNAGLYTDSDIDRMGRRMRGIDRATSKINATKRKEQGVAEGSKELPQWKKYWYAKQKRNSWPKHPQPYHNPKWIDELSPEERKKLTGVKGVAEVQVTEGRVKELTADLKSMTDAEFEAQYKMTKAEARANLKPSTTESIQVGDGFIIECGDTAIETVVVGYHNDGILIEFDHTATFMLTDHGVVLTEAEYHGRTVPLGKRMAGDVKKSKVYVKKPNGKVVKVNFGDPNMRIKKSSPKHRKSFRARHNCENPGPRWKARYWSCRAW